MERATDPLEMRDINAVCYVSVITGEEAEITYGNSGELSYRFSDSKRAVFYYKQYRIALDNRSELLVDAIKMNGYRDMYEAAEIVSKENYYRLKRFESIHSSY